MGIGCSGMPLKREVCRGEVFCQADLLVYLPKGGLFLPLVVGQWVIMVGGIILWLGLRMGGLDLKK